MFRILAADDEELIRRGVQCLLDYERLGFTFCGEAASGDEALEKMLALQPDVVLLDIRMPGMTGLDVLRNARARGFDGKVLIVSGFSDFSYAQEAIRYGVKGYLTKPLDEDELERLLLEIRDELSQSAPRSPVMLRDILTGQAELTDLREEDRCCCQAVVWEAMVQGLPDITEMLSLAGHTEAYEQVSLEGRNVLLLRGEAPIRQLASLIRRADALDGLFLACGAPVQGPGQIGESCRQAVQLMERRFFAPLGVHVLESSLLPDLPQESIEPDAQLLQRYTSELLDCLTSFNRRRISGILQELQSELCSCGCPARSAKLFLADLYLQIKESMHRLYSGEDIPFYSNTVILYTMEQAQFLHEIILFMAARFEMIMNATGTSSRESVLSDVLHYIQHNYASNITLESIASLFGYNRSYLGKILTRKTGMSFNAYIDQVRVEKAKQLLLSSDAKIYAIAEQVGYRNVDYFHIKFRKIANMSPAEYRKQFAETK